MYPTKHQREHKAILTSLPCPFHKMCRLHASHGCIRPPNRLRVRS